MTVWTLGAGYGTVLRSYMASFVPKDRLTTLYTALSVFEGVALLASTPLLAVVFSVGLERGGPATGLPFLVGAAIYGIGVVGVCILLSQKHKAPGEE